MAVQFSSRCRGHFVDIMSPTSKRRVWYNDDEYHAIQAECFSTVRQVKNILNQIPPCSVAEPLEQTHDKGSRFPVPISSALFRIAPEEHSTRGLEHIIDDEVMMQRHHRRMQALERIWYEQLHQFQSDSFSDEAFAEAVRPISEACQEEAHARALEYWEEHELEEEEYKVVPLPPVLEQDVVGINSIRQFHSPTSVAKVFEQTAILSSSTDRKCV